MPAFSFRHIKELYSLFWPKSVELVQLITERVGSDLGSKAVNVLNSAVVKISEYAALTTLDVIVVAALGRGFNAPCKPDTELIRTYLKVFAAGKQRRLLYLMPFLLPGWIIQRIPSEGS